METPPFSPHTFSSSKYMMGVSPPDATTETGGPASASGVANESPVPTDTVSPSLFLYSETAQESPTSTTTATAASAATSPITNDLKQSKKGHARMVTYLTPIPIEAYNINDAPASCHGSNIPQLYSSDSDSTGFTTQSVSTTRSRTSSAPSRKNAIKKSTERQGVLINNATFNGRSCAVHCDASEHLDPLQCNDYVDDIFQYLYHAETDSHPRPYMNPQTGGLGLGFLFCSRRSGQCMDAKMRAILVDWLIDVHRRYCLVPETLYLCVHIIDRYYSITDVSRSKMLVCITALFLACKYEEIYPLAVRDCVYITDKAFGYQEILDMELAILKVLDWKIFVPTSYHFLDRFLSLAKASPMTRHAASYFLERTLLEHDLLEYRPSLVCASVVILALNNPSIYANEEGCECELPGLPKILMGYTDFDKDELMVCMTVVATKICEPVICTSIHLTAISRKYEQRKYLSVSSVVELPSVHYIAKAHEEHDMDMENISSNDGEEEQHNDSDDNVMNVEDNGAVNETARARTAQEKYGAEFAPRLHEEKKNPAVNACLQETDDAEFARCLQDEESRDVASARGGNEDDDDGRDDGAIGDETPPIF
mmetsp:Transcript_25629/g.42035  ORF Transcript_25629/g.42035 Transcript_25629/m.42035 type:complete len:597 (+) Transcript_25629:211-2001(+)